MLTINWLHLSDLHLGMPGQRWIWPDIEEQFFEDLGKVLNHSGGIDLVLFTGDLVFSGTQFELADRFFKELFEFLAKNGQDPTLLAVPGNHDLVRPKELNSVLENLSKWESHPEVQHKLWENDDSEYRAAIRGMFENYGRWWANSAAANDRSLYTSGPLPGDFSYTFSKENFRLGVVGLNTTFLQFEEREYQGHLSFDRSQFHRACNDDGPAWINRHHACLLLTHQPSSWLNAKAMEDFEEISKAGRFAAHLFGHMHVSYIENRSIGGSEEKRLWQGSSLFGLEDFGDHENEQGERIHGYSVGQIQVQSKDSASLRIWPRIANKRPKSGWEFDPQTGNYTLDESSGNCTQADQFNLKMAVTSFRPAVADSIVVNSRSPEQILGFELPTDYEKRSVVEEPVRKWCATGGNLSTLLYVSGGSGGGKSTSLGWLFKAACQGELDQKIVPVWIQLLEHQNPLDTARSIVDSLARYDQNDPVLNKAYEVLRGTENHLRKSFPKLLAAVHSSSVGEALVFGALTAPPEKPHSEQRVSTGQYSKAISEARHSGKRSTLMSGVPESYRRDEAGTANADPYFLIRQGIGGILAHGSSEYVTFYSMSDVSVVMEQLARDLAILMADSRTKTWTFFVDTWDWRQSGEAPQVQSDPRLPSYWLSELFFPALRNRGADVLVVAAGQVGAIEICSRFKVRGFRTMTVELDAFTESEFREFCCGKGVQDGSLLQKLEDWTGRNPQLTRFWFELAGAGEEPIIKEQTLRRGAEWLWQQMRDRMPSPYPKLLQLASFLPSFDLDILQAIMGYKISEDVWIRLRSYGLVESVHSNGSQLFRVKEVFANLLQKTADKDERRGICKLAAETLLAKTTRTVTNVDAATIDTQKQLSLLLMRILLSEPKLKDQAWQVFKREIARWISIPDVAMGKELLNLVSSFNLADSYRDEFVAIRAAWEDLAPEKPHQRRRIQQALILLSEGELINEEDLLILLQTAWEISLRSRDWASLEKVKSISIKQEVDGHDRLLLCRCQENEARGDRTATSAILDHALDGDLSPEILEELGEFAEKTLHDRTRAVKLFRRSIERSVSRADCAVKLVKLLADSDGADVALKYALSIAKRLPNDANAAESVGYAHYLQSPKDLVRAEEWFEKAVHLVPNSEVAVSNYAICLSESVDTATNIQRMETLALQYPSSAWLAEFAARAYEGQVPKDWAKACEWRERAVSLGVDEKAVLGNLALALKESMGAKDALIRMEQLAGSHPKSAWWAEYTARSYATFEPKDWERACEWHERAIRIDPNLTESIHNLLRLLKNNAGIHEACQKIETLAIEFPNSSALADSAGSACKERYPTELGKAVRWHEKAVHIKPNAQSFIPHLRDSLIEAKGIEYARRHLEMLATEYPESAWLAEVAAESYGGFDPKDWEKASEWHERAARLASTEERIVSNLVYALGQSGNATQVRDRFERLATEYPESAWLAYHSGRCYTSLDPQDWSEALKWLKRALQISPGEVTIVSEFFDALVQSGETPAIRESMEALSTEFSSSAWLAEYTARSYGGFDPVDWDTASKWHEKAAYLNPTEEGILNNLIYALNRSEGAASARNRMEKLADKYPESAWIAEYTARCYGLYEPEDWNKAYAWHEQALRLDPSNASILQSFAFCVKKLRGVDAAIQELDRRANHLREPEQVLIVSAKVCAEDDHERSLEFLNKIDESKWTNELRIMAGWNLVRLGRDSDAATQLSRLLSLLGTEATPSNVCETAEFALGCGAAEKALSILSDHSNIIGDSKYPAIDALISAGAHAMRGATSDLRKAIGLLVTHEEFLGAWNCRELQLSAETKMSGACKHAFESTLQFFAKEMDADQLLQIADKL